MEKEKLSTELKGMVGENSLSERTWNDYLDNSVMPFLPSEEDKRGEYLAKHANVLKSFNGQLNNEVATRVNDFKKNYKPDPPKQTIEPQKPEKEDEKLSDIESRLKKFEDAELAKQTAAKKQKMLDDAVMLMKEDGVLDETVLELILPLLEINENTTVEDLAKAGKTKYDKAYAKLNIDSYVPAYGGGYGGGISKKDKDAYMDHLKQTGRITE
ncbi:hypothetical protein [Dysgonomonas sp. 25]|uniref:hypothetical protein n=1 Tax=Dysgonomonas sp. 25 TaxID=2302933 RepID=UPI0013D4388B|nr:hypothetical protein [Dysgonomonas sp. 25]NDV68602.1 hypothetical protein [Dysgonomonas sp. 25]